MIRFAREFHQSDVEQFKLCPRMFYYRAVLEIDPERTSEVAIAGTAVHSTLARAHREEIWDSATLFAIWQEEFAAGLAEAQSAGITVSRGFIDPEEYRHMLAGYAAQPWNRQAELALVEKEFFFEIKPGARRYEFAGRIDQVIRVRTELLATDFPIVQGFPKPEVLIHRDFKTGQRRGTSPFELLLNDQLSIYAYALKYGNVDLDGDGICEAHLDLIPDFHALYFLQDHIPYKRPPQGQPTARRGPGMYLTRRPLDRLERIPRELMPTCASIRRGDFPRQGVARGLCEKYCAVRRYCEADLLQEIR